MDLKGAKVYSDGRHFIALVHTTRPKRLKKNKPEKWQANNELLFKMPKAK